jgi:hypothetical protein
MTFHDGRPSQAADTPAGALIVPVYRRAMAAFSSGETDSWDLCPRRRLH